MILKESEQPPIEVQFNTACLFSKWGFGDGDNLYWIWECGIPETVAPHRVVERHVLPKLSRKVEVTFLNTIHNPVRAITVDGGDVRETWFEASFEPDIEPKWIIISGEEVLAIAREIEAESSTL